MFSRFFFHYSGHGGRVADLEGDEDDDFDETIYPLDFDNYEGESGQITDDVSPVRNKLSHYTKLAYYRSCMIYLSDHCLPNAD